MPNYDVCLPTARRPSNFIESVEYHLNLNPEPTKILITHPISKWTDKFPFKRYQSHPKIKIIKYQDDPGLVVSKFTDAWKYLPSEFLYVSDDDVFCGRDYSRTVFESYDEKPGVYCGIGFRFGPNSFNQDVFAGTWRFDNYVKEDKISLVDAPGQSFFLRKDDLIHRPTNDDLPDFGCKRCHDDLIIGWLAYQNGVNCYTIPHHPDRKEESAVWKLKERDLNTQSLVADNHPSDKHKDKWVKWLQEEKDYVRVEERD